MTRRIGSDHRVGYVAAFASPLAYALSEEGNPENDVVYNGVGPRDGLSMLAQTTTRHLFRRARGERLQDRRAWSVTRHVKHSAGGIWWTSSFGGAANS
jgi:hypothetical protein